MILYQKIKRHKNKKIRLMEKMMVKVKIKKIKKKKRKRKNE